MINKTIKYTKSLKYKTILHYITAWAKQQQHGNARQTEPAYTKKRDLKLQSHTDLILFTQSIILWYHQFYGSHRWHNLVNSFHI